MNYTEELEVIAQLMEYENIRVCCKNSAGIGLLAGLGALAGGLLAGKEGALAGATIGTVASGFLVDDYVSVVHVIRNEMTSEERQKLLQNLKRILMRMPGPATLYTIKNNKYIKDQLISLVKSAMLRSGYVVN